MVKSSSTLSDKKVTIIAIASNEAPYITEWVHHHFYFGFEKIVIGINRTDDCSEEILQRLGSKYKERLEWANIDFIDKISEGKNPSLQHIGYAYLVDREVKSGCTNEILIIDLDEYWTPRDFTTPISDYLNSLPVYDMVSFHWIFEAPNNQAFMPPSKTCRGYLNYHAPSYLAKTLFKPSLYNDVVMFSPHRPKVEKEHYRLNANGEEFIPIEKGFSTIPPDVKTIKSFILHRALRSEVEYIAGQNKPDLIRPNFLIKPLSNTYRNNFFVPKDKTFALELELNEGYIKSLDNLVVECGLESLINASQNRARSIANDFLNRNLSVIEKNIIDFLNKTFGTYMFDNLIELIAASSSCAVTKCKVLSFCESKFIQVSTKNSIIKIKKALEISRDENVHVNGFHVFKMIQYHIKDKIPFSLVNVKNEVLPRSESLCLLELSKSAIHNADVVGFSGEQNTAENLISKQAKTTDSDIQFHMQLALLYRPILQNKDSVGIISTIDISSEIASCFGVKNVKLYHTSDVQNALEQSDMEQIKKIKKEVCELEKGTLFLVNAGGLSNIYCDVVKKSGGIALNVDGLLDIWSSNDQMQKEPDYKLSSYQEIPEIDLNRAVFRYNRLSKKFNLDINQANVEDMKGSVTKW